MDIGFAQLTGHKRSMELDSLEEYFVREDAREAARGPRLGRSVSLSRAGEEGSFEEYKASRGTREEAPFSRRREKGQARELDRLPTVREEPQKKRRRIGPVDLPDLKDLAKFTVTPQDILGRHKRNFNIHGEGILTAEKRVLELQKAVFLE